jgi:hypothetical protein
MNKKISTKGGIAAILCLASLFFYGSSQAKNSKPKKPKISLYKLQYANQRDESGWQVGVNAKRAVKPRCGNLDQNWCAEENLANGKGVHGEGPIQIIWGDDATEVTCVDASLTGAFHWYASQGKYKIRVTAKNTCGKTITKIITAKVHPR